MASKSGTKLALPIGIGAGAQAGPVAVAPAGLGALTGPFAAATTLDDFCFCCNNVALLVLFPFSGGTLLVSILFSCVFPSVLVVFDFFVCIILEVCSETTPNSLKMNHFFGAAS